MFKLNINLDDLTCHFKFDIRDKIFNSLEQHDFNFARIKLRFKEKPVKLKTIFEESVQQNCKINPDLILFSATHHNYLILYINVSCVDMYVCFSMGM